MTNDSVAFARDTIKALLLANVWRLGLALVFVAWSFALYCGGVTHERTQIAATMRDSLRRVQAQELKQIAGQRASDSASAAKAVTHAQATRENYTTERARVKLIRDTVIQVTRDTMTLSVAVPAEIPALIRRADSVIVADSIALRAQAAVIADVSRERDLWKARAENDELELKEQKRGHRFGLKSGFALGVTVVALAAKLLR